MRLGLDAWSLGLEASAVVALRTMKLAAGGQAALDESRRMVAEKVAAAADLQAKAMTGALGGTLPAAMSGAVRHYRRRVRANRRRLTGG
jgi:hypothetical protein